MKTHQLAEGRQVEKRRERVPVEYDADWEYTGEVFQCLECGHEFRKPPYDFDLCPECGADFWPAESG